MPRIPSIKERFNPTVQISQQAKQITELQAEIEQLRNAESPELEQQMAVLRDQLKEHGGEMEVSVKHIDPNPTQPRQTIPESSIQAMARTLAKDGQITPIILVPKGKRYLIWDGQRRWEGASRLEWKKIRAVIAPMPENLHRNSLLTFIHHEDLNPLDKAEAIVKEVANSVIELEKEAIPTVLSTVLRRLDRQQKSSQLSALVGLDAAEQHLGLNQLDLSEEEFGILEVLLDLGLNPGSVKANLLSMLSLPLDLKEAIRKQGLKAAHALALAVLTSKTLKISDREANRERMGATEHVITQEMTVAQTRELVAKIKAKFLKTESPQTKQIEQVTRNLERLSIEALEAASPEQLTDLKKLLQKQLKQVKSLVD
ncbi:ParB/RepB/Spo0J family partition protein [filamentous cyanobacterium LEGE 11480]|uniref:ParB/RepB/Spo0J family partition protein n=1 Tax=Romeriopsis navalis LEGE 11480 TaxID=2777977 RepID=A0A928VS35_9CYAN|nr:ParB/RepB/Spo0J family partition protein [Romeriopsis navalis]MBE9032738.1 ParB/RepB/Spo0J family partition protein [Romeriopsis navalis LEGE 11480]